MITDTITMLRSLRGSMTSRMVRASRRLDLVAIPPGIDDEGRVKLQVARALAGGWVGDFAAVRR